MTDDVELLLPEPVAYADPRAFDNFKRQGHLGGVYGREWMWAKPDAGLAAMYSAEQVAHATAAKNAEIEALRAEVATWEGLHASEVQVRQRWQARAERLAEALRELRNHTSVNSDQIALIDAALEQENDDA